MAGLTRPERYCAYLDMRLRFTRPLAAPLALLTALLAMAPGRARAYDVLATPCANQPLTCGTGAISFSKIDALPIQFNFDTGWVPSGSPVQVDIAANVWANTHVSLTGALVTSWPTTMTLAAPGDTINLEGMKGGDFGYHYGASFLAQGRVDISVLGQNFSWQGNLPYVPSFDLEVQADQPFDAWGYAPGVTISSTSTPQQIASIDLSCIIGESIPGVDGGFALDVAVELDATYVTDRIVVDTTDGNAVPGGPITAPDGTSNVPFLNGSFLELDVHPEGTVDYTGVVHMIPTFYVSLLGKKWDIPIVDVPISFPIADEAWVFTPQRVHFPLPDLSLPVTELDFGAVNVGENKTLQYQLWNAGEALAAATMTTSDALVFPLLDEKAMLTTGQTYQATVDFIPSKRGAFEGQILVASNDPKTPLQIVLLKGDGVEPLVDTPPPPHPHPDPASETPPTRDAADVDQPTGCACRTAGEGRDGGLGFGGAALVALAWAGRRRSTARRCAPAPRRGSSTARPR